MAESQSMTTPEVVARTLIAEHPDFLREAVAMIGGLFAIASVHAGFFGPPVSCPWRLSCRYGQRRRRPAS
jgi:hypothetical protein